MPTVLKMAAPFTLSSAVRMLLEVTPRLSIEEAEAGGEEARRMEALAHLKVGLRSVYLMKENDFFSRCFLCSLLIVAVVVASANTATTLVFL